jgi:hypothetical protein
MGWPGRAQRFIHWSLVGRRKALDGVTGRPPERLVVTVVVPQNDGVKNQRSRACPLQASSKDDLWNIMQE